MGRGRGGVKKKKDMTIYCRYEDRDTSNEFDLGDSAFLYWAWVASVAGPVVYILAVVHAVLWGLPSAIVGSLVI